MATISSFFPPSPSSSPCSFLAPSLPFFLFFLRTRAQAGDLLGDFGARDPFPAEIESGFGDKALGNFNNEHKILIPNLSALSLAQQQCSPISPLQPHFLEKDAKELLKKVIGWRLINEGGLELQCLWKLRDYECGIEPHQENIQD